MRGPSGLARKRAAALASGATLKPARPSMRCSLVSPTIARTSSASYKLCASAGSAAQYNCRRRTSRSSPGTGNRDGAHELTASSPRRTRGTLSASATASRASPAASSAASARLSQPPSAPLGATLPASSTFCASKCERSRYGVATACSTSASRARYIACRFVSAGCRPNVPSRSSTPPSLPGAAKAIGPRNCAYAGSAYGGTAARPSRPPRKMTSTSRASGSGAAVARRPNGASSVSVAPVASNERRVVMLSPQEFRRSEQQRKSLPAIGGVANAQRRVLTELAEHLPGELQRLDAIAKAAARGGRELDALEQCVAAVPIRRGVGPTGRRARGVGPLAGLRQERSDRLQVFG